MGGAPSKFFFMYITWPNLDWHKSPKWNVDYDGQEFEWFCSDLNYFGSSFYFAQVENADGLHFGQHYQFWCPLPTKVDVGSPWLIKLNTGSFINHTYNWLCITDVACTLHVLVGENKPIMSPSTHKARGVVFRHDPRLYFHWQSRRDQHESGDTTTHTFDIPFSCEDHRYWFVALGSVDGKASPSISPFFSFQCRSVPTMRVLDATGITQTTAEIHGWLYDDKGAPCYVQMRYTKGDTYDHYTAKMGPWDSKAWWNEHIIDLEPDTEYKFGSIGSHYKGMSPYGWSRPKYFRTLAPAYGPEQEYLCYLTENPSRFIAYDPDFFVAQTKLPYDCAQRSWIQPGQMWSYPNYHIQRNAQKWNTSIVPVGSKINDAYLRLWCYYATWGSGPYRDEWFQFVDGSAWDGTLAPANYILFNSLSDVMAQLFLTPADGWAFRNLPIFPSKYGLLNLGGITQLVAMSCTDILNNDPGHSSATMYSYGTAVPKAVLVIKAQPPL